MRRLAAGIAAAALTLLVVVAGAPATAADGPTTAERARPHEPAPPRLPANFRARGRWIVRSLGIDVPFTWRSENGNSRMVAGGKNEPIWFVNLIYDNRLYTLTYRWPGVDDHRCVLVPGFFTRGMLNEALRGSRFVGREILQGNPDRRVNHWRVGLVLPELPPGNHLRFPIALADVYVGQGNRSRWWQLLQFGFQNLLDPELDEWGMLDRFRLEAAPVQLPNRCPPPSTPT
jgi:hypothetical protein